MMSEEKRQVFDEHTLYIEPWSNKWYIHRGVMFDTLRINIRENHTFVIDGVFYRGDSGCLKLINSTTDKILSNVQRVLHDPIGEFKRIRDEQNDMSVYPFGMAVIDLDYDGDAWYKTMMGDTRLDFMILRSSWMFAQRIMREVEAEQDSYHIMTGTYIDGDTREEILIEEPMSLKQTQDFIKQKADSQLESMRLKLFELYV